jgi:hypothetical protein
MLWTQERMEVITRAARTTPDRKMSRATTSAPRAFRDAARTSRLVRWRRYSHVRRRRLLARLGSPPASRPPRGPGVAVACPHRAPPSLALWIREPPPPHHRSGNHRHHAFGSGSRSHRLRVHRGARSRATVIVAHVWVGVVTHESGLGVKNLTIALQIFFYRRPEMVRFNRMNSTGWHRLTYTYSNYWKLKARNIQYYIYIYKIYFTFIFYFLYIRICHTINYIVHILILLNLLFKVLK